MAIARKPLNDEPRDEPASPRPALAEAPARTRRLRSRPDLRVLAAVAMLILGVVLVMLGWMGAANTNIFTEQIPYLISGGLLGVALIVVAGVVAAGASLERETRALRADLQRALDALALTGRPSPVGDGAVPARVLVVPNGRTYHVPGCPIPEGKDVSTMPVAEARDTGFAACKLCTG